MGVTYILTTTEFRRSAARSPRAGAWPWPKQVAAGVVMALLVAMSIFPTYATVAESSRPPPAPAASTTEVVMTPRYLGTISKYLFGANLFWAYGAEGAFNPVSGTFYPGFVSAVRSMGVTILRYPGGTTSDSFDWLRAIGPARQRLPNEPYGMQAAGLSSSCCLVHGPVPSAVGPDEFGRLLGSTGTAGTITVNFATGTAQQAADFVAYMTAPKTEHPSSDPAKASYWAGLRARDGHPAPYYVPYWEVGNEQYFRGQFGWRSGRLVGLGPHTRPCPTRELATCLYVFGGTTAFSDEAVGTFANELPAASYSTGAPNQTFYVYFPPVVPDSAKVYVSGRRWAEVARLSSALPGARVYAIDQATGAIAFGDGAHGQVPPKGAKVSASYKSGPHGGFLEFYRAMKAMNPRISVCESDGANISFLQLMGRRYPYDCVQLHDYARPPDVLAPLAQYEERLMTYPVREGAALARLQSSVRLYSGKNVPIFVTEYGQLAAPVPAADPTFNMSLDEGLLIGAQLVEWADHGIPVAEKYLLDSSLSQPVRAVTALSLKRLGLKAMRRVDAYMVGTGLSAASAMVVHQGARFLPEPSGQVIDLMAHLAGSERLRALVRGRPFMNGGARDVPALWVVAGVSRAHELLVVVLNADPARAVTAQLLIDGFRHSRSVSASVLDGPSATASNTALHPREVSTTTSTKVVGAGGFAWTFPAHSVTLLRLSVAPSIASNICRPASATRCGRRAISKAMAD